jgi:hypothetical protein
LGRPNWDELGTEVTPSVETREKVPGYRSMILPRRTVADVATLSLAEEAEAGSAGEQPAKEYSAGTHRSNATGGARGSSRFELAGQR